MSAANSFINIGAAVVMHDLPVAFGRRRQERAQVGTGGDDSDRGCSGDHRAALRDDGRFSRDLRLGTVCVYVGSGARRGTQLGGCDARGSDCVDRDRLVITLALETAAYFKAFTFPAGVTASAVSMVSSFLVFFVVSWLTRRDAQSAIDPDVRLVMEL